MPFVAPSFSSIRRWCLWFILTSACFFPLYIYYITGNNRIIKNLKLRLQRRLHHHFSPLKKFHWGLSDQGIWMIQENIDVFICNLFNLPWFSENGGFSCAFIRRMNTLYINYSEGRCILSSVWCFCPAEAVCFDLPNNNRVGCACHFSFTRLMFPNDCLGSLFQD